MNKHHGGQEQNPYYKKQNSLNNNTMPQNQALNAMPEINNQQAIVNQNPYIAPKAGFSAAELLTGALIGAAATYILTNENVQKTLFKGALSISDILSGGLDEMKERFEDAKAEREAQKEA